MTLVSLALFRSPSEKHHTREGDLYKRDTHAGPCTLKPPSYAGAWQAGERSWPKEKGAAPAHRFRVFPPKKKKKENAVKYVT